MTKNLKAIPTSYHNYRFRSRLEARHAVFMNTLGIEFRYEDQGYDLDGIWYLPDFFLPTQDIFLEIKGDRRHASTEEALDKAARLASISEKNVYILFGDIWMPDDGGEEDSALLFRPDSPTIESGHWWCVCPICKAVGLTEEGRADLLPCKCVKEPVHTYDYDRVQKAYRAAREASFGK